MAYFNRKRKRWMSNFVVRGKRYSNNLWDTDGKPVNCQRAADEAEAEQKRSVKRLSSNGAATVRNEVTLAEVVTKLKRVWKLQARWPQYERNVREMLRFCKPDTPMSAISDEMIADYMIHLRTETKRLWKGGPKRDPKDPKNAVFWVVTKEVRAPATVNTYLEPLRQCLQHASKMRDPFTGQLMLPAVPQVGQLRRPKRKARPVPDHVLLEIIGAMPSHVLDAIMLTMCFGFRLGEVFALTRLQVDYVRRGIQLYAENVKDDEDDFLPGSQFAMGYLRCLDMEAEERGVEYLITWRRHRKDPAVSAKEPWRPLKDPHYSWGRAQKIMEARTGRTWRWHDMRAAFITYVALTSGPVQAQSLARHSDIKTTMAYVAVADEMRRVAVERVSERPFFDSVLRSPDTTRTNPTQNEE